ncbi:MAG TPA: lipopolysaccharide kinase InaA family protein [Syntrophorhabdaceae bacterium]|nr:lipopolysaccharide kinase InaA family protein [Syntrophorhabdaceae bacterium]HPU30222.1 lipopolysaccharide kinase InaA family protein [Syntrophorhabdaceae bacterium]
MAIIKGIDSKDYRIYFKGEKEDIDKIIKGIENAKFLSKKGRGGIKVFFLNQRKMACRQYLHGGILRGITRDRFISAKRAINEMEILTYLRASNISAVEPLCVIEKKISLFKKLYLITFFEDDTENLLEYFTGIDRKKRLRMAKKVAELFWSLEMAHIYHPDLHLDNILVKHSINEKDKLPPLILLDFDGARRKIISKKDMENMFWRLNRYTEKMEKKDYIKIDIKEKILFLKTYERLSGRNIIDNMRKKYKLRQFFSRTGWIIESFFYKN